MGSWELLRLDPVFGLAHEGEVAVGVLFILDA